MSVENEKLDLEAGEGATRASSPPDSVESKAAPSKPDVDSLSSPTSASPHTRGDWKKNEVHEIPKKYVPPSLLPAFHQLNVRLWFVASFGSV